MALTARVLPAAEWSKLANTEADRVWRQFEPDQTTVVVVEDGDSVVGTWVLLRVLHAECVWIAPTHRHRGGVARRLVGAMRRVARSLGSRTVWTSAATEDVASLAERLGGQMLPGSHFILPVQE